MRHRIQSIPSTSWHMCVHVRRESRLAWTPERASTGIYSYFSAGPEMMDTALGLLLAATRQQVAAACSVHAPGRMRPSRASAGPGAWRCAPHNHTVSYAARRGAKHGCSPQNRHVRRAKGKNARPRRGICRCTSRATTRQRVRPTHIRAGGRTATQERWTAPSAVEQLSTIKDGAAGPRRNGHERSARRRAGGCGWAARGALAGQHRAGRKPARPPHDASWRCAGSQMECGFAEQ